MRADRQSGAHPTLQRLQLLRRQRCAAGIRAAYSKQRRQLLQLRQHLQLPRRMLNGLCDVVRIGVARDGRDIDARGTDTIGKPVLT